MPDLSALTDAEAAHYFQDSDNPEVRYLARRLDRALTYIAQLEEQISDLEQESHDDE
jgi:hypothetical protein